MRIPLRKILPIRDPVVIAALNSNSHEKLFSGPRNCSKSMTVLLYALAQHEKHEGFQSLILRSELKSMGTVYDSLNNKILRYGIDDRRNPFVFKSSSKEEPRPHLLFDNGGKMCFGGMDNSQKALGAEADLVFYNQGERERKMNNISTILGCMEGGRAGNWKTKHGIHYCLIIDANPSHKKHILMQRVASGAMEMFEFTHKSHPMLYDWDLLGYTTQGIETIAGLKRAYPEGFERDRMVYGKWTNATGMVYPQFIPAKHHVPVLRSDIPDTARWSLACDYGRTNAVGIYAKTADKLIMFKEIYRKDTSVPEIVGMTKGIQERYSIPKFAFGVGDHEFNGKKIMQDAGLPIKPANKKVSVKDGIELGKNAFANDDVVINTNSLESPDPKLVGEINCLVDEFAALHYLDEDSQRGNSRDDLPDPQCADHSADQFRYEVVEVFGKPDRSGIHAGKILTRARPDTYV